MSRAISPKKLGAGIYGSLFFGKAGVVQASLNHAENRIAGNHADDVALLQHGHLIYVLALHAFEDAHDRLMR